MWNYEGLPVDGLILQVLCGVDSDLLKVRLLFQGDDTVFADWSKKGRRRFVGTRMRMGIGCPPKPNGNIVPERMNIRFSLAVTI